jgi:hypothetical protein
MGFGVWKGVPKLLWTRLSTFACFFTVTLMQLHYKWQSLSHLLFYSSKDSLYMIILLWFQVVIIILEYRVQSHKH